MESDPSAGGGEALRRLHPFSWLFVLLTQLRPIVLPLLVLLFLGQGEWWELFIVVGAVGYALYSLIYSVGFRYRIGADELLVKEGIFSRTERHIPYARIQNIVRRRNPLHRLFGVAELRLESAGGTTPEAIMNVITLAAAEELEAVLRSGHADAATPDADTPALLALSPAEILRLGLLRNRGGVLIGAIFALAWQFGAWESMNFRDALRAAAGFLFAGTQRFTGPLAMFFSVVMLSLLLYVAIKLFSIVMAFLEFHGFRLVSDGARVATEGGLLTRHSASARVEKIQRLVQGDSWLSRRLGRRWLRCEVAAGLQLDDENSSTRLQWLVPVGTPEKLDEIVAVLDRGLEIDRQQWQPLHPRAWRRVAKAGVLMWTLASAPVWFWFGWQAAVLTWLATMVVNWFGARGWARFAAYSCHAGIFAYRSGWLSREWLITRIAKGQGIQLSSSPFDRRAGMSKVELDTAGASQMGSRLQVPYLGEAQARALMQALRTQIDAPPVAADSSRGPVA